jgi:hypothetical protein
VGKSKEEMVVLPRGIVVNVPTGGTVMELRGVDSVDLGNALDRLSSVKPRNAYTGVGVLDPLRVYPKLKSTKRGVKK